MLIVRFCTIHLVVFSGFLTYTYAMVDRGDKNQPVSHRQDRQLRPVLNSIIFLIAANLVAKGALGLGTYQAPPLPGNIQGSLFLTLNAPHNSGQQAQQYQPFPIFPYVQPKPVSQTQVINIGDPAYEDVEVEELKDRSFERAFANRYNTLEDPLEVAASNEYDLSTEIPSTTTSIPTTTETPTTPEDVELLPQNATNEDEELIVMARQFMNMTTTTTTTMRPTPVPTQPASETPVVTQMQMMNMNQTKNETNATKPSTAYGPPNGYPQVSFVYGPPGSNQNQTNGTNPNATHPGYNYFPAGDYGPYTGNENISITYGPPFDRPFPPVYERPEFLRPDYQSPNLRPVYQRPAYQKPFLSSPEDPYLNRYSGFQNNFEGFYNNPSFSNTFKYSDFYKSFYNNKFDYNYPLYNNNYLGKK